MRPIASSTSCNTLVSLEDDGNNHKLSQVARVGGAGDLTLFTVSYTAPCTGQQEEEDDGLMATHLLIRSGSSSSLMSDLDGDEEWGVPTADRSFDETEERDSDSGCFSREGNTFRPLFIPQDTDSIPIDRYLLRADAAPELLERNYELLQSAPRELNDETVGDEKVLNILQGEVGHATSEQADIIVSDRATTCHILALRSESGTSDPLATLCHLDRPDCDSCLRKMVEEHRPSTDTADVIDIEVHIVGGYDDCEGTSVELSEFLLRTLSSIAADCESWGRLILQTCAISSLNDSGLRKPVGRGLGMRISTGEVFLAHVDLRSKVGGPAIDVRSCRLWSPPATSSERQLHVVHTAHHEELVVNSFEFRSIPEIPILLSLPDEVLLQYTSTSPEVEEQDFCVNVRRCLRFLHRHAASEVFGDCMMPLRYQRRCKTINANSWVLRMAKPLVRNVQPSRPHPSYETLEQR